MLDIGIGSLSRSPSAEPMGSQTIPRPVHAYARSFGADARPGRQRRISPSSTEGSAPRTFRAPAAGRRPDTCGTPAWLQLWALDERGPAASARADCQKAQRQPRRRGTRHLPGGCRDSLVRSGQAPFRALRGRRLAYGRGRMLHFQAKPPVREVASTSCPLDFRAAREQIGCDLYRIIREGLPARKLKESFCSAPTRPVSIFENSAWRVKTC